MLTLINRRTTIEQELGKGKKGSSTTSSKPQPWELQLGSNTLSEVQGDITNNTTNPSTPLALPHKLLDAFTKWAGAVIVHGLGEGDDVSNMLGRLVRL